MVVSYCSDDLKLTDIAKMYLPLKCEGAIQILLNYYYGEVKVSILMTDDCEPYWDVVHKQKCTLDNWAKLLYNIQKGYAIDEYGNELPIIVNWV